MLLLYCDQLDVSYLVQKYPDKILDIATKTAPEKINDLDVISYIEDIKQSMSVIDVVLVPFMYNLSKCLDVLKIDYSVVCLNVAETDNSNSETAAIMSLSVDKVVINSIEDLEAKLAETYDWVTVINDSVSEVDNTASLVEVAPSKLTFEQLIDDNVQITEADIREFKATQNKLKIGLILQAKSSLNRILKMSITLDKLYDELLDRVDNSLKTTDTASLMYTTEYISKALNETNQFIMSLVNNEKIQNFFIIDNSSVVNIGNDRVDISKRERIRKAVEVVLDNIDYFADGDFEKLKDPNIIEVKEDKDANIST